jgi:hypothetical protein
MREPGRFGRHDGRSGPWAKVPTRAFLDPNLSRGALRLLGVLASHARDGQCRVGDRLLANRLGSGYRWDIQRWVAELEEKRYITAIRLPRRTTTYIIHYDEELDGDTRPDAGRENGELDGILASTGRDLEGQLDGDSPSVTEEQKEQREPSSISSSQNLTSSPVARLAAGIGNGKAVATRPKRQANRTKAEQAAALREWIEKNGTDEEKRKLREGYFG